MSIVLDRAEFFALAALFKADEIIGLDTAVLLPDDVSARQALYDIGRAQLLARDLLRVEPDGSVAIDEGLSTLFTPLASPETAVLALRHVPEHGRQVFLYYERAGRYVEQTLPDESTHRLESIGDRTALIERLLTIYPINASGFVPEALTVPASPMGRAFRLVEDGQTAEARALLEAATPAEATLAGYMVDLLESAQFSGSITLARPQPGKVARSIDIVVVQAPDEAWGFIPTSDTSLLNAERMNRAVLRQTLEHILTLLGFAEPER